MDWTRKPVVAGRFYSRDAQALATQLGEWLDGAKPTPALALVAPHAGYVYSGAVAAAAYQAVKIPGSVILLCPNHTGLGEKIAVWDKGAWETPLGPVLVDEALAATLLQALPHARSDRHAHLGEHAIEVHLPFLRFKNPDVRIVPIVLGPLRVQECVQIGLALAEVIKKTNPTPLIVASTDMSHYMPAERATELDALALSAVEKLSGQSLYEIVVKNDISMCGFIPTTCTLEAARQLGARSSKVLRYATSGDVSGDFDSVVGYAAAVIS